MTEQEHFSLEQWACDMQVDKDALILKNLYLLYQNAIPGTRQEEICAANVDWECQYQDDHDEMGNPKWHKENGGAQVYKKPEEDDDGA